VTETLTSLPIHAIPLVFHTVPLELLAIWTYGQ
jgi:hypothetical protein